MNKDIEYYLNQLPEYQVGEPSGMDMNKDWKERFDEEFVRDTGLMRVVPYSPTDKTMAESIKDFIESLLKEEREKTLEEERQFILNILDGIDIADKEAGILGGTKAIRFALESRVLK